MLTSFFEGLEGSHLTKITKETHGVDLEELKRWIEDSPSTERSRKWSSYHAWLKEGAKAQPTVWQFAASGGMVGAFGCILVAIAFGLNWNLLYLVPVAALSIYLGILGFKKISQAEREWRQQNPFRPM